MNLKKRFFYFLFGIILAFSPVAAAPARAITKKSHCYALISPVVGASLNSSRIVETACFDTFAEAINAATQGRVQLDSSIHPENVTDEMLNNGDVKVLPVAQIVIGIDWDSTNFGGSSYTWVVSGSGCSSTVQYSISSMPSGWDNRVSSAKAYSNCNGFYHYQNTNLGGSFIVCNSEPGCSSMGPLDNATSSEKWTSIP